MDSILKKSRPKKNANRARECNERIYKAEQGDRDLSFAYMRKNGLMIRLEPLQAEDREQFIIDNQEAFNYGALEEFGLRDDHMEEFQFVREEQSNKNVFRPELYRGTEI